ncbi:MAG: IclR family transcriptional regulator [Myxococcota bacterium]
MPVKPIQSAVRVLGAVEVIARRQPLGLTELARHLETDKSSAQRVLATLERAGWIRATGDGPVRWELTTRVLSVANEVRATTGLRERIRATMVELRDRTGETVVCAVPDGDRVVLADVVESAQLVRSAPTVGLVIPTETSASGRALLAAMRPAERERLAGRVLTRRAHAELDEVRERGSSLSLAGDVADGSTNLGAAILDERGAPIAALAISAVSSRMSPAAQRRMAQQLVAAVAGLHAPTR